MASVVYKANPPQFIFPHLQKIDAGWVLAQLPPEPKVYRVRGLKNPAKDEAVDGLVGNDANSFVGV